MDPDPAPARDASDVGGVSLPGGRRGWTLRQRFAAPDSYGLLLCLILLSTLSFGGLSDSGLERVATVTLLGVTLLFALRTSRAPRLAFRIALVVVPMLVVASIFASSADEGAVHVALICMTLLLLLAVLVSVVLRIGTHLTISWETILAGICIYLLVGLVFGSIYNLLGALDDGVLFAGGQAASSINTTYFSFITLTTVGYGDFTLAENLPRMVAVTEAVMGQVYLVVAVGLLVGNLGRTKRPRVRPPASEG